MIAEQLDFTRSAGADVDLPTVKKTVGQCDRILSYLLKGWPVENNLFAMDHFKCIRIGARIHDLRHGKHDGTHYNISGNGTPEKPYRLEREEG